MCDEFEEFIRVRMISWEVSERFKEYGFFVILEGKGSFFFVFHKGRFLYFL